MSNKSPRIISSNKPTGVAKNSPAQPIKVVPKSPTPVVQETEQTLQSSSAEVENILDNEITENNSDSETDQTPVSEIAASSPVVPEEPIKEEPVKEELIKEEPVEEKEPVKEEEPTKQDVKPVEKTEPVPPPSTEDPANDTASAEDTSKADAVRVILFNKVDVLNQIEYSVPRSQMLDKLVAYLLSLKRFHTFASDLQVAGCSEVMEYALRTKLKAALGFSAKELEFQSELHYDSFVSRLITDLRAVSKDLFRVLKVKKG